jgi:hypothetical protein
MVKKIYTKLLATATMGSELVDCVNSAVCAIGKQHNDVRVRSRQFGPTLRPKSLSATRAATSPRVCGWFAAIFVGWGLSPDRHAC